MAAYHVFLEEGAPSRRLVGSSYCEDAGSLMTRCRERALMSASDFAHALAVETGMPYSADALRRTEAGVLDPPASIIAAALRLAGADMNWLDMDAMKAMSALEDRVEAMESLWVARWDDLATVEARASELRKRRFDQVASVIGGVV